MSRSSEIAATLMELGRIQGEGIRASGAATAGGIQQAGQATAVGDANSGQIWGHTLAGIGNAVSQLPAELQQRRLAGQEEEIRGLQINKAKQDLASREAVRGAIGKMLVPGPNGSKVFDPSKFYEVVGQSGVAPDQVADAIKPLLEMHQFVQQSAEHNTQLEQQKVAKWADIVLGSVQKDAPITPEAVYGLTELATKGLAMSESAVAPYLARIQAGEDPQTVLKLARKVSSTQKAPANPTELAMAAAGGDPAKAFALTQTPKGLTEPEMLMAAADPKHPQHQVAIDALALKPKPAGATKSFQRENMLVDGKPAQVLIDPDPGAVDKVFDLNGQVISNAAQRVKPIPPASAGASGQPGAERLTPDAIEDTATAYRILGTRAIPTRIDAEERKRILNEASKQTRALGSTAAQTVQQQFAMKADGASLTKATTLKDAASAFENKALAQIDIIKDLSAKVGRSKWPLVNSALQSGRTSIAGDENATKFANAISTFAEEYAKIINGTTSGAAAATDSTRAASRRLISTAMSQGTMNGVLDLMSKEMGLTIKGWDTTIGDITKRMGGAAPQPTAPVSSTTSTGGLPSYQDYLKSKGGR